MRTLFLLIGLLFVMMSSNAQKKSTGIGGELSVLSLKPSARWWVSKTDGFDIFAGVSAEFEDFHPNDYEAGMKYLRSFINQRTDRTYFGLMGKWKHIKLQETSTNTSLPAFGIFVGKEWYTKHANKKGFAVELGYQYGSKQFRVYNPVTLVYIGKRTFTEFPLLLNIRYTLYKDR